MGNHSLEGIPILTHSPLKWRMVRCGATNGSEDGTWETSPVRPSLVATHRGWGVIGIELSRQWRSGDRTSVMFNAELHDESFSQLTRTESSNFVLGDLEEGTLYPGLSYGENELRWGFIQKVYGILAAQIVLTTIISSVTVLYSPLNELLRGNSGILFLFAILPFILMVPLYIYQQKHPLNFVFLGLFTACLSVTVAVACANTEGRIVLEALILTSAVVSALTGYTFWAAKKGKDFSYLGPILFTSLIVLILTGFIQMFFPLGPTSVAIYGGLSAMVFSAYIVYDTDNLIKRFTYDEYIWASVVLYLDVLNLFLSILRVLRGMQSDG
ncbi:Bax inhibitor 1-related [Macleaya cordata]|uniref:Bax inhibitor 1-related n=1 Tax=Macleaya cordata TaxID=56857 RepID=A0A200RBK8_MACCD|nr:Bax inhibitor 1-related [Macleaya cordata]